MKRPSKYNGQCVCGHEVSAGAEVELQKVGDKWKIVACPKCRPGELAVTAAPPVEMRVVIQRITHASEKFTAVKVVLDGAPPPSCPIAVGQTFSVAGRAFPPNLQVGDMLDVQGSFEHSPEWGWQLRADRVLPAIAATDQSLVAFLRRFPQVGNRRAEEILRHFGGREATLNVLDRTPERLAEVPGITAERALEIGKKFQDEHARRDALLFLSQLDLGDALQAKILEAFGEDTRAVILEDPYQLMELDGVGLKTADDVAKKLKIQPNDPRRVAAATLHLLEKVEQEGATWSDLGGLLRV
jgi:exodeoxyribonuclease V alpha subunit